MNPQKHDPEPHKRPAPPRDERGRFVGTGSKKTAEKKATTPGRDQQGKFAPGGPGGPGRPPAMKERAYLRRFRQVVTPDRMEELIESLFTSAVGGDVAAARLILNYLLPEAAVRTAHDAGFADPAAQVSSDEFRRAGATWGQLDKEFLDRLGHLMAEQKQFEAAMQGGPQR